MNASFDFTSHQPPLAPVRDGGGSMLRGIESTIAKDGMTVQVGIVNLLTRGGLAVKGKQHGSKLERSKILEMSPTTKGSFMFLRFEAPDLLPED